MTGRPVIGAFTGAGVLLAALLPLAAAAASGPKFAAPEGCEVFATVQARQCQVFQLYRCAGDPPGDQWMASIDGKGLYFLSRTDSETRWVESLSFETGERRTLGPEENDPASFTTLLQTGRDDFDFTTVGDQRGLRRFVGHDMLTGKSVTIDGVPLEETRFESVTYDAAGAEVQRSTGQQYISREWRRFFPGTEVAQSGGETMTVNEPPVTFAFPGEEGFLSTDPEYDCDVLSASLVTP